MSSKTELQSLVVACNNVLGLPYTDKDGNSHPPKVFEMDAITLLRNCHPQFRTDYAGRLYHEKEITKAEAIEFIKILGEK